MAYYTEDQLRKMGFKSFGANVKISVKASIYDFNQIEIGNNSRIDDFCIISGKVKIGSYCHITPQCLIAGGLPGITILDFCTLAYGVRIFSQSDDYSGQSMVNSMVPKKYKNEKMEPVTLGRQTIIGSGSTIFPGVNVAEGCSIGAMTLVVENTKPWGVYAGIPARRIKDRSKALLALEDIFLKDLKNDPI